MNKLRNGIFISELLLLFFILICCTLDLKVFCLILIGLILILEGLSIYINRQIRQVIHYCKIKSILIANQQFEEADKLTSGLTNFQKFIVEDMEK